MSIVLLDMAEPDQAHVAARLDNEHIAWLATTRSDGRAQTVPVWFAWTGERIVVFSADSAAKVRHLRKNPLCSIGLETADAGNDVVLIDATAEIVRDGSELVATAEQKLATKYGLGDDIRGWRAQFSVPIVLHPERIVGWSKPEGQLRYTLVGS